MSAGPYANSLYEQAMNEPIRSAPPVPDCEETMGLFGSLAFWIAGLICLGLWGWLAYYVAVLP